MVGNVDVDYRLPQTGRVGMTRLQLIARKRCWQVATMATCNNDNRQQTTDNRQVATTLMPPKRATSGHRAVS